MEIKRDRDKKLLTIRQYQYVLKILQKYTNKNLKPAPTLFRRGITTLRLMILKMILKNKPVGIIPTGM